MYVAVALEGLELVDEADLVLVEGQGIREDEEAARRDDPRDLGEACADVGEMVEGVSRGAVGEARVVEGKLAAGGGEVALRIDIWLCSAFREISA